MRLLQDTHAFLWFVLNDPAAERYCLAAYERPGERSPDQPGEPKHVSVLTTLPLHHRDPFDSLLVAQALVEGIPLVSADAALDQYPITRFW
jgi:PIN domain nuclease of toxin-antitoxin system